MSNFKTVIIAICGLFISFSSLAQNETSTLKLNAELDLIQPIFGGIGGAIGMEKGHWGGGFMAFSTPLQDNTRDIILSGAENFEVHNWGVEVYGDYYFKENHTGFYASALLSLDGYKMKNSDYPSETILGLYAVPRVGYRWVMTKKAEWLYLQPSFAIPIKVWDDSNQYTYEKVDLNSVLFLPMLTLGVTIPIK